MGGTQKYSSDARRRAEFAGFFCGEYRWKIFWLCEILNMQERGVRLAKDGEVLGAFSRKIGEKFQTFCKMYKKAGGFAGKLHENARLSVEVLGIS